MAEPLKNHFGSRIPKTIAAMIAGVWPQFPSKAFLADALEGFDALELMDRGRHLAHVLRRHLPPAYPQAVDILVRSASARPDRSHGDGGMASFLYLPHVCFVSAFGLDDFESSMAAQYELTQRFTAEFSIRPFLERYPERTLARLRRWARDPSHHVRRLVSEGTRPRLPWAGRLRAFQADPRPVLELLELLKDDPSSDVRRSVANNLNDIGKDHPDILIATARRWMTGADEDRRALVRHALRSLVKQGNSEALKVLGFGGGARVAIEKPRIAPRRSSIGGRVTISCYVRSLTRRPQPVVIDLRVHFVRGRGRTAVKVFKLKTVELLPDGGVSCRKTLSLADLTTRRHYPGRHRVDVVVNGRAHELGAFVISSSARRGRGPASSRRVL